MLKCITVSIVSVGIFGLGSLARADLSFEKDVRPILKAQCFHCHGEEEEPHGGLDVRLVRLMAVGGESGEAIVPGNAEESLLWHRIAADEMPEGNKKLTAAQKETIRNWIDAGAKTLRPEPEDVRDARFTEEELSHWAFQPVGLPQVPMPPDVQLLTPVDGFIAAELAKKRLKFSRKADRRTMIRRLSFSLLGLPPSPAEVKRFLADSSPDAYERLVERLLASPQYGVHWGRHWLDVAGYSETNGTQPTDGSRPHIWRYRDYVIDALNENRAIDRFFTEQLAGDELVGQKIDPRNSNHQRLLTATGFLRLAPDETRTSNSRADRNGAVAETLKVISSSMLGVTVGCAQCHDHKYDPIGIDDYYRFRAVFDPLFPLDQWRLPGSQTVDFTTDEVLALEAKIEAEAKLLEDDIRRRRDAHGEKIQQRKLDDVPESDRQAVRDAVLTAANKQTEEQKELLKTYPMVKPVSTIAGGLLVEYDAAAYRKFEKENQKVAAIRETKPSRWIVSVTREQPDVMPVSRVFFRGNPETPGESVMPAEVAVMSRGRHVEVPLDDESLPTSGRRLAYARQLTDGTHPLTARVFVNRVWLQHFGRGLVATPGDFGISGARPTHPELLDWLANELVQSGWDLKHLHRQILLSRTFQQTSTRTEELNRVDPENELWGRTNLRRLQAEAIRDSIHFVINELDTELGGPSLPVVEAPDGKVVIGKAKIRDGLKTGVTGVPGAGSRRSLYIQTQRRLPLNMLATFDLPEMNPNCEVRVASTVAPQSLWFMNDEQIIAQSERLGSVVGEKKSRSEQIRYLFELLFSAEATESELTDCLAYLERQQEFFRSKQENNKGEELAGKRALASLCQLLLGSNRFLYVD